MATGSVSMRATVFYYTTDDNTGGPGHGFLEMIPFPTDIVGGANVGDYHQFVIGSMNGR